MLGPVTRVKKKKKKRKKKKKKKKKKTVEHRMVEWYAPLLATNRMKQCIKLITGKVDDGEFRLLELFFWFRNQ